MKIDFDAEKHEYSVGGVKIPSVSEILAPLSADRYDGLNPWMLKAAAAKGTAVHEATELIDYGIEPEEDSELEPYLLAYQTFLCEHEVEWEMIERIVYYKRLPQDEIPLFAGTVDRFGKVNGKYAVVDIKTYASLSTDAMLNASCQTALYAYAIDDMQDGGWQRDAQTYRYVLHLRKDGTYRFVDLNNFDKTRGFNSGAVAWWCYSIHNELAEARKNRKRGKNNVGNIK